MDTTSDSRSASPPRRATLGPIIPPSLPFVIYGMMANVSVGQLFLAGIVPGLVMALLMMLTVAYYAHKYNWGSDIVVQLAAVGKALLELAVVIGFPLVMWGHGRGRHAVQCRVRHDCLLGSWPPTTRGSSMR